MTESEIQRAVFDHLRARAFPDVVFWHCPNDLSSRRKPGFLAGVSDVNAVHKGKFYALELKKDGGRPSVEQLKFVSRINATFAYAAVAEGLPQALGMLEAWNLIREEA